MACGCQVTSVLPPNALKNPRGLALVCIEQGDTKALSECASAKNVRPLITGGSVGSVAVAAFSGDQWTWLDLDGSIPGFTPLMIGDLPTKIVTDAAQPGIVHMTLALKKQIVSVDSASLSPESLERVSLDFLPVDLLSLASPTRRLYLSDPDNGRVWRLEMDEQAPKAVAIEVGGSPFGLAAAQGALYVAHRDHPHVTIVSLQDDAVIKRISLRDACNDGIDNDGDGLVDRDDSGCDGPNDPVEGDPEVGSRCSDGLDNDGDGQTDAVDFGCAVTPTEDHCRDGIDNDGDGLTDYPADPGCFGYGSSSERFDAPACADGIDNDDDGMTDTQDPQCTNDPQGERVPLDPSVIGNCGDGIDNDGDGFTDLADSGCDDLQSDGEKRPACDDGIDNDGDGFTDLADKHCFNRLTPSEVGPDRSPASAIAASFQGSLVVVTDQSKQAIFVIDAKSQRLLNPSQNDDFARPSTLDSDGDLRGIRLGSPPLALAPVTLKGQDAMAVTTRLGGLMYLTLFADNESGQPSTLRSIGLLPSATQKVTTAQRPSLLVDDAIVDLGIQAPERYAHFGTLNLQTNADSEVSYFGWSMSTAVNEHRSELWKIRAQGTIPGTKRTSGRLMNKDILLDPSANFCGLGVVPGDLVIIEGASSGCVSQHNKAIRYEIIEVGPQHIRISKPSGRVDVPVTSDNQVNYEPGATIDGFAPQCYPQRSVRYEVRANGWLVTGSTTGLLSRRGQRGQLCAPWDNRDLNQAARIGEPQLKSGADAANIECPMKPEQLSEFEVSAYGAGQASEGFENLLWSATLMPGCVPAEAPGAPITLLPSIREATWNYAISRGFTPVVASVGASPVAVQSGLGLSSLWVIDQGAGTMHTLTVGSSLTSATLD